ncbi:FAM151 family protein [Flavobacterium sp. F372]|uniref:Uncharacterized protein n=1 Tax=Flavobacterium bernardetii TaxID=2813823 RepID=A0ABR7J0N3_9FLAO|nr:FAM151 family protein [Flavobacterium bernardetii]MBC5835307.1 hypothetical protein [Flavobacterium bernardetii]NHF69652.1 FAM151 family protein [Flavobacterium bernardetii]
MTRDEFILHLRESSLIALKFAEHFVKDKLTTDFKYNVILNASNDDLNFNQFDFYQEDNGIIKLNLIDIEVIDLLYRKNKVPVWININVLKSSRKSTTFNLLCAGRFTDNKEEFYYNNKIGSTPFGIKSPELPIDYSQGKKFSL